MRLAMVRESSHHCLDTGVTAHIIILDETTAGQDYYHYTEIMNFLDDLNRNMG